MAERDEVPGVSSLAGYALLGAYFAVVLAKSEAIAWFRIQEMFRFQAFHMYGLIGSAVLVAGVSLELIRRTAPRAKDGEKIDLEPKERTTDMVRYWAGGAVFGVGWALLGACPGPLYTLAGGGVSVYVAALLAALGGTYVYGVLRERLPH